MGNESEERGTVGAALALEAALCEPLPLEAGQSVALLGESALAAQAVHIAGGVPIVVRPAGTGWAVGGAGGGWRLNGEQPDGLPLASAAVDHIVVPRFDPRAHLPPAAEMRRVLRPGGWVAVGVRPARSRAGDRASPASVAACARWLEAGRFEVLGRYGLVEGATDRSALVPLDHLGAVQFFVERLWVPPSRWPGWARAAVARLAAAGRYGWLFKQFVVVGRSEPRRAVGER